MQWLNPFQQKVDNIDGIPMAAGRLPLTGHRLALLFNPAPLVHHGLEHVGPLFWIDLGFGDRMLMCSSEESFELFRSEGADSSHFREQHSLFLGARSLISNDGAPHRRMRRAMYKPFTPRGLDRAQVGASTRAVISRRLAGWPSRRGARILTETREITLEVIFSIIGVRPSQIPAWRKKFNILNLAATNLPWHFPGSPNWWAAQARKWMDVRIRAMLEEARAQPEAQSLLAGMVHGRDERGQGLDEEELTDNVRLLILAGHETSASVLAWMLLHLAAEPRLWEALCDEAAAADVLPTSPQDLARFPFAESLFREALRLHPPVATISRRVIGELTLHGQRIPVGSILSVPLFMLSRNAERYPEPDRFRPERWLGREVRLTPLEMCQFGGGGHFCLGYHLAVLEGVQFALGCAKVLSAAGKRPSLDGARIPDPVFFPLQHPPRKTWVSWR